MQTRNWGLFVVSMVAGCGGGGGADEKEPVHATSRQAIIVPPMDDRTQLGVSELLGSPLRAVGKIPGCSATKIASNYLVSASHCFPRVPNPANTTFYPAFVPNQPNASVGIKRVLLGTQGLSKPCISNADCSSGSCDNGACNYFEGGADFALLEVDPQTFNANGSTLTPTWDAVPTAELVIQAPPPPPGGVSASAVGYSADAAMMGFAGRHAGCMLTQRHWIAGMYQTSCDFQGGASGGAIFRFDGSPETQHTGIISGNGDGATFNAVADNYPPYWSPWDPGGIAAVLNADGRVHVYASDHARWNQMMLRAQFTTTGYYPTTWDTWRDVRSGIAVPNPGRVSGALFDARQFVFMVGSDQQVYANIQVVPSGNLTGWQGYFHGDPVATSVVDIASNATSTTLFQYLLRTGGNLVLKRKVGVHNAAWEPWQTITPSGKYDKVAANDAQGVPLVLLGGSQLDVTWATDTAGTSWIKPKDFSEVGLRGGLPIDSCLLDFELGRTLDGKLDAFALITESCSGSPTPAIWRRTKLKTSIGGEWAGWYRYRSLTESYSLPGVPLGIPNPQLAGATGLGLLPNHALRGDGLIVIARGNLYASFWADAANYEGWAPFYGPVRPW